MATTATDSDEWRNPNPPDPSGNAKDDPPVFQQQEDAGGKMALAAKGGDDAEAEAEAWVKALDEGEPTAGPGDTEVEFTIVATGEEFKN